MSKNGSNNIHCISYSYEETKALGAEFAKRLGVNSIVCFFGELGSGKTTFIKGIAETISKQPENEIISPTFAYLNIYKGSVTLYHFDLYRLKDADEFLDIGFDEMFFAGGICCLEWSEKIAALLPEGCIKVTLTHLEDHSRQIDILFPG